MEERSVWRKMRSGGEGEEECAPWDKNDAHSDAGEGAVDTPTKARTQSAEDIPSRVPR